ncbi:Hypothetical predicted protein [Octopus vulgaris]|uniref:Uncharacterized protein n=1 Tax=Octopus vulgaris TaxID=6645 RepID=A0AA36FIT9_OCTVU|nr:Hypothetical predicted protein [Octopus vulgaris]
MFLGFTLKRYVEGRRMKLFETCFLQLYHTCGRYYNIVIANKCDCVMKRIRSDNFYAYEANCGPINIKSVRSCLKSVFGTNLFSVVSTTIPFFTKRVLSLSKQHAIATSPLYTRLYARTLMLSMRSFGCVCHVCCDDDAGYRGDLGGVAVHGVVVGGGGVGGFSGGCGCDDGGLDKAVDIGFHDRGLFNFIYTVPFLIHLECTLDTTNINWLLNS